jgi:SHS2 domain-containing protein
LTTIRYLDHDADVGFEVTGPDLDAVWQGCARALIGVMTDPEAVQLTTSLRLEIESLDLAAALVDSLGELLFRFDAEGLLLPAVDDLALTETADGVTARFRAHGEPLDPTRHEPETGVKAVTHHGATVEQRGGGEWFARILVDI